MTWRHHLIYRELVYMAPARLSNGEVGFAVHCHACGQHVQHTGQGGFDTSAEARACARGHMQEHRDQLDRQINSLDNYDKETDDRQN